MKRFLCIFLSLFCLCVANAQEIIEGVVKNKQDMPIANALVRVDGKGQGCKTASDGSFKIEISSSARSVMVEADGYCSKSEDIDGGYMLFILRPSRSEVKKTTAVTSSTTHSVAHPTSSEVKENSKTYSDYSYARVRQVRPEINKGYQQYIQVGVELPGSPSLNYIGGYRFNKSLFLGLGTGVNTSLFHHEPLYSTTYNGDYFISDIQYKSQISIPVYLNFRYDIRKENWRWNPYISTSVGCHFATSQIERFTLTTDGMTLASLSDNDLTYEVLNDGESHFLNYGLLYEASVGVNCRLTDSASLYIGVGYKLDTGKCERFDSVQCFWDKTIVSYANPLLTCVNNNLFVVVGVSF